MNYLRTFPGVIKLNFYPAKGKIILYYKEEVSDLIDFLNLFEKETEETLLDKIGKTKVKKIEEKSSWFKWVTFTALPYLFIGPKGIFLLSVLTLLQGVPIFKKGLKSIKENRLDVHFLDSLALLFLLS